MRCQQSGKQYRVLEVKSWTRRKYSDGQPERAFLLGWPGHYRRVWLARYTQPTVDACPYSTENVLSQIIRAIDDLNAVETHDP